jgi:hypothetical protein
MVCLRYRSQTRFESQGGFFAELRFVSTNAKFSICTVVGLNGTLVENKMHTF